MYFLTWDFWDQALERAVKTAAQTALTVWVVGDQALNVLTMDWELGFGVAGGGALVSVLTSLASGAVASGGKGNPSLVSPEVDGPGE